MFNLSSLEGLDLVPRLHAAMEKEDPNRLAKECLFASFVDQLNTFILAKASVFDTADAVSKTWDQVSMLTWQPNNFMEREVAALVSEEKEEILEIEKSKPYIMLKACTVHSLPFEYCFASN